MGATHGRGGAKPDASQFKQFKSLNIMKAIKQVLWYIYLFLCVAFICYAVINYNFTTSTF